jgi:hypothetical protein
MAPKVSMSLHGIFALIMRSISKMTSSVNEDEASESLRLYQAQSLIHSRLIVLNHLYPPSNPQQEQEPSSNLQ